MKKSTKPRIGKEWGRGRYKKKVRAIRKLSNNMYVIKTDNKKSEKDFKVKVISISPRRVVTPKHAHFAIDLYGKKCASREKAKKVLKAIIEMWQGKKVSKILDKYEKSVSTLPGYSLKYILYVLKWIFQQEDLNFSSRPQKKQKELEEICKRQKVPLLSRRRGSHLAIALLCDIMNSTHPVEALLKANLDIKPRK